MNGGGFDRPVAPIEPEPDDVPEDVAVPPVALRPDLLRPRFPRQPDGGVDAPDDFPELSPVEQRPDPLPPGVESEAPGRLRPATVEKVLDAGPVQVLAPGSTQGSEMPPSVNRRSCMLSCSIAKEAI